MVSVQEAHRIILSHLHQPSTETVQLMQACDRILAERIYADRDLPPFDRVTMDGIALSHDGLANGKRTFRIESIQRAGEPATGLASAEACIEIMTGAVLPPATDMVIRYEDLDIADGIAQVRSEVFEKGQNIHRKGSDVKRGEVLLEPPVKLSPAEISMLATVGKSEVAVVSYPRVAILSTGDELVRIDQVPADHQIRQSNSYALYAALKQLGINATLHHQRDDPEALEKFIAGQIENIDILLISGGVSKGKYDHIPAILERLGVAKHFHGVAQRPGKPFWFGTRDSVSMFAFPGNPVSTFLCFHRYFIPWWNLSLGLEPVPRYAILAKSFSFQPKLTFFVQVTVKNEAGKIKAFPVPGGGSGDFANLRGVDGFLELPPDRELFEVGEVFPFIPFRLP